MSKNKRAPSREELIREIAGEIGLHYPNVMCAAEAILDVASKAAAEIADAEMAVLKRNAKVAVEAGDDAAHYRANAAWWSVRRVRNTILALTSEGVKE